MTHITDEFGFSLGPGGWHPFTALLDGIGNADHDDLRPTDFERFLLDSRVNAVRDLNDVLDLSAEPRRFEDRARFWLGTYPWGGLAAADIGRPGPAFGWAYDQATGSSTRSLWGVDRTIWYRPESRSTMANERRLTRELMASMKRGYRPIKARGFPRLTVLRRSNGDFRAVIVDGHHRLAVLAHLGASAAVIEVEAVVDEGDVDCWHAVRHQRCSPEDALAVFEAFFHLNGSERFNHVSGRWGREP